MTQQTKYIGIAILVILIIILGYFYTKDDSQKVAENGLPTTSESTTTTTTPTGNTVVPSTTSTGVNTTGFSSYTSGVYNFNIKYPKTVTQQNSFSTFHEIGNNWRLNAAQANQGKPVVSFSIFNMDQGSISNGKQSYPLYFTAEVRIGVSPNVKECYTTDAGFTSQKVTSVNINGVIFKKFSASDAAMMKYVQSESYRVIHNNQCFVLEQIKNGSNYQDERMKPGLSEATLTSYYNLGETIIKTFKFTK